MSLDDELTKINYWVKKNVLKYTTLYTCKKDTTCYTCKKKYVLYIFIDYQYTRFTYSFIYA